MPKNANKCQGFETFQRMNYLFQIQNFMAANVRNTMVSSYYGNLMTNIAKKSVLRIDPKLKRRTCKKCKVALIPDITAKVKVKPNKKAPIVKWKCLQCSFMKQYPVSDKITIWTERPESIVQVLDYGIAEGNAKNEMSIVLTDKNAIMKLFNFNHLWEVPQIRPGKDITLV